MLRLICMFLGCDMSIQLVFSLVWPDRVFPFFFVVAEKRVWCNFNSRLVLTTLQILEMLIGKNGK